MYKELGLCQEGWNRGIIFRPFHGRGFFILQQNNCNDKERVALNFFKRSRGWCERPEVKCEGSFGAMVKSWAYAKKGGTAEYISSLSLVKLFYLQKNINGGMKKWHLKKQWTRLLH
jgi:hypothetical protein